MDSLLRAYIEPETSKQMSKAVDQGNQNPYVYHSMCFLVKQKGISEFIYNIDPKDQAEVVKH